MTHHLDYRIVNKRRGDNDRTTSPSADTLLKNESTYALIPEQ